MPDAVAFARHVETRGGPYKSVVVPALGLPKATALVIDQVDGGQPLGPLHPISPRDDHARGVAVA